MAATPREGNAEAHTHHSMKHPFGKVNILMELHSTRIVAILMWI